NESYSDQKVSEGKPVCTVCEKRIAAIRLYDTDTSSVDPREQASQVRDALQSRRMDRPVQQPDLAVKRECRDPAQDQAHDEDREPEADTAKMVFCVTGSNIGQLPSRCSAHRLRDYFRQPAIAPLSMAELPQGIVQV